MERFRPDIYQRSIYDIDYQNLKNIGIKCIIFDLDNTLAPLDTLSPEKKLLELLLYIEDLGIRSIILSNASKRRVTPFKEKCNLDSAYKSHKPLKKKYQKILDLYHLKDTEVACIGDQLLTDIWGANRMGFTSILVNPISKKEHFPTKINRFIEHFIYLRFKNRGLLKKGEYYD